MGVTPRTNRQRATNPTLILLFRPATIIIITASSLLRFVSPISIASIPLTSPYHPPYLSSISIIYGIDILFGTSCCTRSASGQPRGTYCATSPTCAASGSNQPEPILQLGTIPPTSCAREGYPTIVEAPTGALARSSWMESSEHGTSSPSCAPFFVPLHPLLPVINYVCA